MTINHPGILILDFGSQFTQLIARKVRELGVYSEVKPCTLSPQEFQRERVQGVILSGGPASVTDADAPRFDRRWLEVGVPILGVCYGMQLIAQLYGGKLARGERREYGFATIEVRRAEGIFSGFSAGERSTVWMSHGDHVDLAPPNFQVLASSESCPVAAMANTQDRIFGVQFHPEVVHTPRGREIIERFVNEVVGSERSWKPENFVVSTVNQLRAEVGPSAQVICALSGGVDSTVAAVLVHKAIAERLHCIYVENGLQRKHETEEVRRLLGAEGLDLNLRIVNASGRFLEALRGVTDPEQKRKTIGRVFIEVFEDEAQKIQGVTHLVQGTLYPDVIESVSVRGPSATIKSHHNVGGLPPHMKFKLLEPLRELFKDEVRLIGRDVGVPEQILERQPFPGPGLAVRILGEVTEEKCALLREADAIFQEEVRAEGVYRQLWQSFAVLLPVQSVGVMGDGRTYERALALRAVTSEDGMTADWAYLPQDLLRRVSNRIINEVRGINRVVLDISSKPPATIEWE